MSVRVLHGDCREVLKSLADESVHCCITSPPYYGLRDYGTAKWEGGDPECEHKERTARNDGGRTNVNGFTGSAGKYSDSGSISYRHLCRDCGARRIDSQIGLEPTPSEYVAELVSVFREVRRVLRKDGTVWVVLGDSYAASGRGGGGGSFQDKDVGTKISRENSRRAPVVGYKPKDILGIPWMVAFALRADGWWLRSSIIWCLSGGARVYARTQKGEMPIMIKDLVRLNPATVQLWNGKKWTQVLGWNQCSDPDDALEIELRSGERIGCTANHQWPTTRGLISAENLRNGDVIETTTLPEPPTIETPKAIGDEVGYLIGLYIAEGSLDSRGRMQFAGHASEFEHRMSALGYLTDDFGASVRGYVNGNNSSIIVDSPIVLAVLRKYVHGKTAHDKGLKVAAWRRSNEFLRSVLEGYLSGDGHYDEKNDRYRLTFTRNDRLAADFRTLCARLGLPLRLAIGVATGFGKEWPIYRGDLRLVQSTHHNARQGGEVVGLRNSRARQFWDIGVADEPHLFALASGVLTHNSKPNPMPESVTDRPTSAHENVFLLAKSARYFYDAEAVKEPAEMKPQRRLTVQQTTDNGHAVDAWKEPRILRTEPSPDGDGTRNLRNVWTVATQSYSEAHFATFPPALIEPCLKAGTSERGCCPHCGAGWVREIISRETQNNEVIKSDKAADGVPSFVTGSSHDRVRRLDGKNYEHVRHASGHWAPSCSCPAHTPIPATVLDCFAGAGTTGLVADRLGRNAILIDLNQQYAAMTMRRLEDDAGMFASVAMEAAE